MAIRPFGETKAAEQPPILTIAFMNAIVSIGGCSAAFVSPNGLIATNYHCVEGSYLQYNSTKEDDLFATGFTAVNYEDEKPSAPEPMVFHLHN